MLSQFSHVPVLAQWFCTKAQHRGQTFAHAQVVVRAELSARTKTEEKYISERLDKALEKRVNKITRG